ncbi:hypothetical protein DH2020_036075 [Rehmannia glutinosa]|uniref:RNA helicase n=1 Tax=Rehmannia glutinosa TaxID=99300 RepID=A0ABR0V7C7_REHGL
MGDHQVHRTRIKRDLVVTYLRSEQGAIGPSTGNLTIGHSCPKVVIVYSRGSEGVRRMRGTLDEIYHQRILRANIQTCPVQVFTEPHNDLRENSIQSLMSSVRYKSDDEYSVIGDKGDIGFVDFENCGSICSYNPSEESQMVNISIPFPLVKGKPQSGFFGETIFDSVTIKNISGEPLDLWSVSIYDSKPENSFTISLMEPPTVNSDVQYIQDFMETFSLEDRVLRTDQTLKIWLSCKPKEIGLHTAAVHFSVGDETIERLVFVLAEDKISRSLSSAKPYQRSRRKKQDVVNVHAPDAAYVMGLRPSKVNEGLTESNYGSFFKTLLAMEEIKLEEDMRAYDMECVTMKRNKSHFLSLEVPGLAEKRPSLVNGDYIFVKLVTEDQNANVAYQGYIHRVEAEEIFLKFDQKFHHSHRESDLYNVQFTYNRTSMRRLYQAVEAAESLHTDFLFPSESSKMRLVEPTPLVPISCTLNEEQMSAIEMILARKGGPPYLIHGPQREISTDQENEIFRLNAFTRPFEDVNPNHIEFCYVEDFIFKCPSRWDLVRYRIIISTYTSASLLYAEGIKRGHFSYVFLDEAGQASEPETMVPLSQLHSKDTVVVLAGDPMQLGPVVISRDAERYGLGTSYLERLFGCELYGSGNENFMTKLVRNYRTHEAILRLPSDLFYDGELLPCKEENSSFSASWEDILPNKEFPLLFIGIQGCDEREGSNPSWFNRIEASKVVEMIRVLIDQKGMVEDDIGVITPYRQQVSKIRGALESLGWANVKVGSVEQFQGQERQVIIISTVRSTIKHNEFDRLHYLGFLSNPRRFNVAITRARSLLVGCFLPEKEDFSAEGPPGTEHTEGQYLSYNVENDFQPSEEKWDKEGGNWQCSEVPWGLEEHSNQSCEVKNDSQPSEVNWDDEGDRWRPSDVKWSLEEDSNQPSDFPADEAPNHFQPSDVPWE